ncbi:hypothetical protein NUSPORA_01298 [Nucleospora cyclopteri]
MQFNKNSTTIEGKFLEILLKEGCITEKNAECATKVKLSAASRTDKNVSASFNVIQVKINQELTEELKIKLKDAFKIEKIELYEILRVPNSFLAYKKARSREYKYFVPTFVLENNKFLPETKQMDSTYNNDVLKHINKQIKIEQVNKFQKILQFYVKTHNFHNFTTNKNTKSTERHIRSIEVKQPFVYNEIEYVEVLLHGNSFIIHQIRKMMSFAVANCRYVESMEKIEENFKLAFSNEKLNISKAPAEYLMLHNIRFDDYNKQTKYGKIEVNEEKKHKFEKSILHPTILKMENLEQWFILFSTFGYHHENFSYLK